MRLLIPVSLLIPLVFAVGCEETQEEKDAALAKLRPPIVTEDIEEGEGAEIKEADRVMIEYVGRLDDTPEIIFDRNDQKDENGQPTKSPYAIRVGTSKAIVGLEEGLIGMKKGGTRKITIPWQKGYGLNGTSDGKIAGKEDLEFTVKVLEVVTPADDHSYEFTDVKVGSGREAKEGDKVAVHYRAGYVNGMVFDDSKLRGEGGTPLVFRIGAREVINGVDAGVRGMKVGGVRRIWMAPMLAFGDNGYGAVQGGQVLIVDVELLGIE